MHSDPKGGGQNLDSLLIMPIQRIPRYILLLEVCCLQLFGFGCF